MEVFDISLSGNILMFFVLIFVMFIVVMFLFVIMKLSSCFVG